MGAILSTLVLGVLVHVAKHPLCLLLILICEDNTGIIWEQKEIVPFSQVRFGVCYLVVSNVCYMCHMYVSCVTFGVGVHAFGKDFSPPSHQSLYYIILRFMPDQSAPKKHHLCTLTLCTLRIKKKIQFMFLECKQQFPVLLGLTKGRRQDAKNILRRDET